MAEEVSGRPIAPPDRGRPGEVLVAEPLHELANGLVFLLERAEGMRSRRRRPFLLACAKASSHLGPGELRVLHGAE